MATSQQDGERPQAENAVIAEVSKPLAERKPWPWVQTGNDTYQWRRVIGNTTHEVFGQRDAEQIMALEDHSFAHAWRSIKNSHSSQLTMLWHLIIHCSHILVWFRAKVRERWICGFEWGQVIREK